MGALQWKNVRMCSRPPKAVEIIGYHHQQVNLYHTSYSWPPSFFFMPADLNRLMFKSIVILNWGYFWRLLQIFLLRFVGRQLKLMINTLRFQIKISPPLATVYQHWPFFVWTALILAFLFDNFSSAAAFSVNCSKTITNHSIKYLE